MKYFYGVDCWNQKWSLVFLTSVLKAKFSENFKSTVVSVCCDFNSVIYAIVNECLLLVNICETSKYEISN